MTNPVRFLRENCLNFGELLAINIALISPTMTAALIVPLMFGTSGNAGWLAYAFGTVMLLFVAFNLNQFTRRTAGTGSMFSYAMAGLGPTAGSLAGWCLIWSYLFIGTAGMTGFATFAKQLLTMAGVNFPAIPLFCLCGVISWALAWKDIQVSTVLMLVIEGISMGLIFTLVLVTNAAHGFAIDTRQLTLSGSTFSTLGLGVVVAVFSLVGFEAAAQFGHEAKNPLKTIPASVVASLLIAGAFFVVVCYTEVMGLRGSNPALDKMTAPLAALANGLHVGYLNAPLAAGAMLSFFSLASSCMNAGARIIYAMGQKGVFHDIFGSSHESYRTPHIALTVMAMLQFMLPTLMLLGGLGLDDAFNDAGTFGAFGFIAAYFFISVAAPMYLKKAGQLRPSDVALSVVAVVLLLVPAVGTVYPPPTPPVNMFVYVFVAYFLIGLLWFVFARKKPSVEVRPLSMPAEMPASEVA
jgi:amino acid transporter